MTTFANAFAKEATHSRTENGATCLNTTGSKVLDFFGVCGALRNTEQIRIERLFSDAYAEDKLLATRCLFYSRDVREGLGERKSFRQILKYAAQHYPECIRPNIDLIGEYGRYDDLYTLIGTPLEDDMWVSMKKQFVADLEAIKLPDEVCEKIGIYSLTGEGVYVVLIVNDKPQETDDTFMDYIFE